ncbi:MAG: hypothetical protein NVS3B1_27920 [Marmoricola sp.]
MADTPPVLTGSLEVGALIRRQVRVALDVAGIRYREHKGLLDSSFVVTATQSEWAAIQGWVRSVNDG